MNATIRSKTFRMSRRSLLLSAALLILLAPVAMAGESAVNVNRSGLAIKGYDAVGYFDSGQAVRGNARYSYEWNGARWQFASKEHRDAFAEQPERYAPQFGGFCALGVAHGKRTSVNPRSFVVRDGKLYLFYDKDFQKAWEPHAASLITQAEVRSQGELAKK